MSRHVLLVEPDDAARALMDRVLTAEGYGVHPVASIEHALEQLFRGTMDAAIVDEIAGTGDPLSGVRFFRHEYPTLPIVVTGTMLSQRVLLELVQLGVVAALPKPFTPDDLRASVASALARTAVRHTDALEYAAAVGAARRAIMAGQPHDATIALARVHALAPLDAEGMVLEAVVAELTGRDRDADRACRAALALGTDEGIEPPNAHEGLARLAAYAGARPARVAPPRVSALWVVTEPCAELALGPPRDAPPDAWTLFALGMTDTDGASTYIRTGARGGFAIYAGVLSVAALEACRISMGDPEVLAHEPTRRRLGIVPVAARGESEYADERAHVAKKEP